MIEIGYQPANLALKAVADTSSSYRLGLVALNDNRLAAAEQCLKDSIQAGLAVAAAWNAMGVLHLRQRRVQEARTAFLTAKAQDPAHAGCRFNLGLLLKETQEFENAVLEFREAAARSPGDYRPLLQIADCYRALGKTLEARRELEHLVNAHPEVIDGWTALGELALAGADWKITVRCYEQARALGDKREPTLNNLGWAYQKAGNFLSAIQILEQAVELYATSPTLWRNLADAYEAASRLTFARLCSEKAVAISPETPASVYQYGFFLYRRGDYATSLVQFRRAIDLKSDYADAHNMAGNALVKRGQPEDAIQCFEKAIQLNDCDPGYFTNQAIAYRTLGYYEEAACALQRAISIAPHYADAQFGLSMLDLLQGRYRDGWRRYEWRLKTTGYAGLTALALPRWQGEPLQGKHLFVHAEQGFGDTIQFVRYLRTLKRRYQPQTITFSVDPNLLSLFQGLPDIDALVSTRTPPAEADYHVPLLSIPGSGNIDVATDPVACPYLVARALPPRTKAALFKEASLSIGLVWHGRATHANDYHRSIDLATLLPLIKRHPDCRWISLQWEPITPELTRTFAAAGIIDATAFIRDFADTAAIIQHLDLVISVDTAVVHLASALAKPVWTLLPFDPDWRWRLNSETTHWYPTMRLFRQPKPGDWQRVLEAVDNALLKLHRRQAASTVIAPRIEEHLADE